jgi:uncharacterized protein YhdP
VQAELEWQPQASQPLATLGGHLHMQFEQGTARVAAALPPAAPFPLFMVPALMAGMELMSHEGNTRQLKFARLVADFELHDGEARTTDLHLDGDAEILLRGRVGLLARDYDAEALILRGEERLPAAVRRLGPTPKVAAAWLALRELVGGSGSGRSQTALRLHGTWDDPIVVPEP